MTTADVFAVPAGTRFRKHEHDTVHVCVVLAGGFIEREKKGWRDVAPGTVRVSGASRHDIDFSNAGATCLLIEGDFAHTTLAGMRFIESDHRLISLAHHISEAGVTKDPSSRVRKDDLTTELIAQVDRRLRGRTSSPPPWLDRVRDLIHATGGSASMAELACEAGVHRVHVARTFRDHYGMPVTTYARKVRVQGALSLLATSKYSLSRLAAESGFADQSHLTREVRVATGLTPGRLRSELNR